MNIDWGDAPAWAAIAVAVISGVVAVWSVAEARKARKASEFSARASARSADAAERSADADEKAHQLAEQQYRDSLPPAVGWVVERPRMTRLVLRNIGTEAAHGVTVQRSHLEGILVRGAEPPENITIHSGMSRTFYVAPDQDHSVPEELWVKWEGQSEPVAVSIPDM